MKRDEKDFTQMEALALEKHKGDPSSVSREGRVRVGWWVWDSNSKCITILLLYSLPDQDENINFLL